MDGSALKRHAAHQSASGRNPDVANALIRESRTADDAFVAIVERRSETGHDSSSDKEIVNAAIALVRASTREQSDWAAVRFAAVFRRARLLPQALEMLDVVCARTECPDTERAAYACAVAVHCDAGDHERALIVGEDQLRRSADEALLKALLRAAWERYEQTGDDVDRSRWLRYQTRLDALPGD